MKVYIVFCGQATHDESPMIHKVFAKRDDAVALIEKEFEEEYQQELIYWNGRPNLVRKSTSDNKWFIEATMEPFNSEWFQETVWTIVEREVL